MQFLEGAPNFHTPDEETPQFEPTADIGDGKDSSEESMDSPCATPPTWMEWEAGDSSR